MSASRAAAAARARRRPLLLAAASSCPPAPKSRSASAAPAYEDMSRDNKAMQDDDTANPGMLAVLDGEALWQTKAGGAGQVLRRLPRRRDAEDEGRRGALSGVRAGAPAGRSISSSASTSAAPSSRRRTPFAYESRELLALTAYRRAAVARRADRAAGRSAAHAVHRNGPRAVQPAPGPAQSRPARNATTTTGARASPATRSRRRIRPDTRSTGWNGRASARCSGGCAIA